MVQSCEDCAMYSRQVESRAELPTLICTGFENPPGILCYPT